MKSILLAFAMFSRIPMPRVEFEEKNMRYVMAAFPLVGVAIGMVVLAWEWTCTSLAFGPLLRGAGLAVLPVLVNGGIHMDGFCDTVDALASHGDVEKKQRILRDPHTGSFAAVAAAMYLLVFAALGAEGWAAAGLLQCFVLSFIFSRSVAGLATLIIPGTASSSLARSFQTAASKKASITVLAVFLACLGALMCWRGGVPGIVAFAAPLILLWRWKRFALKQFGGMSGDLSGCLLQLCEMASLASLVVIPKILLALQ